jgi:hypothetical protein
MQFILGIVAGLAIVIALIFLVRIFLNPKGRRTLFNVVSWVGFALIIPGLMAAILITVLESIWYFQNPDTWWSRWEGPGPEIIYFPAIIMVYIGTILMLLGGLIARPRHFPMIFLGIGISCIIAFYGLLAPSSVWDINVILVIITLLPGMACIIGSFVLRQRERQIINQTND